MKKINYQTKFLLYHTGIMFIIICLSVMFFNGIVIKEMKEKEMKDFTIIAEKTSEQLDSFFYEMDKTALQIAANPMIVQLFQNLPEESTNYFKTNPIHSNEIKKLLESYNFKTNGHSRICLYNQSGDLLCTSNIAISQRGIDHYFESDDYQRTVNYFDEDDTFVYHKKPQIDVFNYEASKKYLAVTREIKDYFSTSKPWGFIEVQESFEEFEKILNTVGDNIVVKVNDKNNSNVYTTRNDFEETESEDLLHHSLNNAPYDLSFYKMPQHYGSILSKLFPIVLAIIVVLLIVAVLLEKILIKHLTQPLIDLNEMLGRVSIDNPKVSIANDDSTDIVKNLEDSFNVMFLELNESMNNQIISNTNTVKSQYFALQSQMNPHFLHNMLAIISMEAQLNENVKIPEICQRLGGILRYNTHMDDGYTTIGKEVDIARDYMDLMKVRYEDLFSYNIEVDDSIRDYKIPKLIIQPICENCFKHGFISVEPEWLINIKVWKVESYWYIKIMDNGEGFSDEFLNDFQNEKKVMNSLAIKQTLDNLTVGGMALKNIYMRLRIEYGERFVFEVFNEHTGGVVLIGGRIND